MKTFGCLMLSGLLALTFLVPAPVPRFAAEAQRESPSQLIKKRAPRDVPLLDDISIAKPPSDVPPELAAFVGVWSGELRGERTNAHMADQVTVVEKVSRESFTLVSMGIGRFNGRRDYNYGQTWAVRTEYPVKLEDGALTYTVARNGNRVAYRIKDGRLTSHSVSPNGGTWIGTLERIPCCGE